MKKNTNTEASESMDEPLNSGVCTADAGQEDKTAAEGGTGNKPSWEEILSDPDYKGRFDAAVTEIVRKRLGARQNAEDRLAGLESVFSALRQKYGVDCKEQGGADTVAALILGDTDSSEREADGDRILRHLITLVEQEAELRQSFPEFELIRALDDPAFVRLTAPHTGISLTDAYSALHRAELDRAAEKRGIEAVARSLGSLGARPRELNETHSPAETGFDPRSMTRQEREELKKRIYEAKAQGKKLAYGQ